MNQLIYVFLFFGLVATGVQAQVTNKTRTTDSTRTADSTRIRQNTQTKPDTIRPKAQTPPAPRWTYSAGLDGIINSGNVNRRLLTIRLSLSHENPKSIWGFFTSPRYQYGTNNEILQEREIFADFNNTWFYAQHDVYGLFFGTYEQSNLRQINHRMNVGAGLGWRIINSKLIPSERIQLSLSSALLREITDFATIDDRDVYRISTRAKVRIEVIKDKLTVQNTTFFQPAITENNLRWNSISQLVFKLTKSFALTGTLDNSYESVNVQGVQSVQLNASLGLSYSGAK